MLLEITVFRESRQTKKGWRFFQSSETKPGTGSVQDICQAQKPFVLTSFFGRLILLRVTLEFF